MTGTVEGVKLMTQLITSIDVSGIEAEMWMTTLAFLQNPTIEMLNDVKVTYVLTLYANEQSLI